MTPISMSPSINRIIPFLTPSNLPSTPSIPPLRLPRRRPLRRPRPTNRPNSLGRRHTNRGPRRRRRRLPNRPRRPHPHRDIRVPPPLLTLHHDERIPQAPHRQPRRVPRLVVVVKRDGAPAPVRPPDGPVLSQVAVVL